MIEVVAVTTLIFIALFVSAVCVLWMFAHNDVRLLADAEYRKWAIGLIISGILCIVGLSALMTFIFTKTMWSSL